EAEKEKEAQKEAEAAAAEAASHVGGAGDSLQLFLADVGKHKLLTAADEVILAKAIERGDPTAKRRMIESNLRLVVSIAKGYRGLGVPFLDLIQAGTLGLNRAVEQFDWRRGRRGRARRSVRRPRGSGSVRGGRGVSAPPGRAARTRRAARARAADPRAALRVRRRAVDARGDRPRARPDAGARAAARGPG